MIRFRISRKVIITGLLIAMIFAFVLPHRVGKASDPQGVLIYYDKVPVPSSEQSSISSLSQTSPPSRSTAALTQPMPMPNQNSITEVRSAQSIRSDFSNAIFIGDSITYGFLKAPNTPVQKDHIYAKIGAHVFEGVKLLGNNTDLISSRCDGSVDYIFIMFGANDYGYDTNSYKKWYKDLVKHTKEMFPNAKIVLQSVMPMMSTSREPGRNLQPEKLNKVVKMVAAEENVNYLNLAKNINNARSFLLADGLHFKPDLYPLWIDVIRNNETQLTK